MTEKLSSSLAGRVQYLRGQIAEAALRAGRDPAAVRLMAVTKTQPAALVNEAIAAGVDLLGENRAQEMCARYGEYNRDKADIHFIGHLQTNKVKQVVGKAVMIESVDSLRLAQEISKQSEALGLATQLLIEVNIGGEGTKSGVAPEAAEELARQIALLPAVSLRGLMAIPPIWNSEAENEPYFARMAQLLVDIRAKNIDNVCMEVLSMGMSGDYAAAIRHGSTQVRIGTGIFGTRN